MVAAYVPLFATQRFGRRAIWSGSQQKYGLAAPEGRAYMIQVLFAHEGVESTCALQSVSTEWVISIE